MQYSINSEEEYRLVMEKVKHYLQRVIYSGGFQSLNSTEQEELHHLSLLAEAWEDGIPLMLRRQSTPLFRPTQIA